MFTTSKKTVRDGLLVANSVSAAIVNTSSQNNLLQALANFHRILTPEEYARFSRAPVPGQSSSGTIELARGISGEKSRLKFQQLSFRFEPFIRSIQRFSTVIDTIVSAKPEVAALIWGSVKFIITVALDYFGYFEKLSKVFERLGDLCPFFDRFQELLPESDRLRESLADFYAASIAFCTGALKFLKKSTPEQIIESIRKPFSIGFEDLEAELQRQQVIVDREIHLASEAAAHRARQEASLYRNAGNQHRLGTNLYQDEGRQHRQEIIRYQNEGRQHRSAQMIHLEESREQRLQQHVGEKKRKRKLLLDTISSYDHRSSFSGACHMRHQDTGLWLFDIPEFKEWNEGQRSCGLWCYGIPGAGKTILTAGVIDYLFLHHQQSTGVSISYFFCDFATKESIEIQTILRSLIKQIISVFEQISPEIERDLERMFLETHREPGTDELNRILLSITQLPATVNLIIDGLDECKFDDRYQLLTCMNELIRDSKSKIKILISSRPKVDISRSLKGFSQISLDSAKNHSDIEIYIRETIDKHLESELLKISEPSMAEEIKEALIRGSDGMFLWVKLQILEICRENSDNDIRRALRSLPKGLDGTYSRILERIVANHKPVVAKKVFTWLAVGRRPLSLDELNEAVAFEPGCLRWDQGNFQTDTLKMLQNCGNLVNHNKNDGTVRFAHYTVLEYLVSQNTALSSAEFFIHKQKANLYVGQICLTYLNFPDFETQLAMVPKDSSIPATTEWIKSMKQHNPHIELLSKVNPKRLLVNGGPSAIKTEALQRTKNTNLYPSGVLSKKFCLLDYIAKNWIYHCSELPQDNRTYWDLFNDILFHKTLPLNHLPWPCLDSNAGDLNLQIFWWAVEAENSALLRMAYSTPGTDNRPISEYSEGGVKIAQKALLVAISRGKGLIIQDLVHFGADVNAPSGDRGLTALQAAAGGGHLDVVNRLLEVKADVNAPAAYSGRTALQVAAGGGHLDVVNRLLEVKANINAEPARNSGLTALQAAAGGGHLDVVNRLLEVKADVNAEPVVYSGLTALQAAAGGGHLDVVNRLLEVKADVNAGPGAYSGLTALQVAAGGGHLDVVNRLLEVKADVNTKPAENLGRTALQAAAGGGHLDVVNRLLEVKADVNAESAQYSGLTALQAAAGGGHLDVVNRLLEVKANINAEPARNSGLTALQAAAGGGHLDVVNRLLEVKADVNAESAQYSGLTALQAATEGDHLDVIERLRNSGARK